MVIKKAEGHCLPMDNVKVTTQKIFIALFKAFIFDRYFPKGIIPIIKINS